MHIDYNILARDYDLTRTANINTINLFAAELPLDGKTILDFGCGTGNFAYAISKLTTAAIFGVEPSTNKTIVHSNHGETLLWLRKGV